MTGPTCKACTRPVADSAYLCQGCTDRLARDLGDIGALAEEVQTTRLRQSRTGGQATGVLSRSSEKPLPWDERAAEVADVLRSTVVAWARVVAEERGRRLPENTMTDLGRYLLANLEWLRHHDAADECADEIGHVVALARRTVDRHQERAYAGPCRADLDQTETDGPACCTAELYVQRGARTVDCPHCGSQHDVDARHRWLLGIAADQLVTATDLSRFLSAYGEPLTAERIRQWAARGLLVPHGKDQRGRPTYLVRDAVERLATLPTRPQRRSA